MNNIARIAGLTGALIVLAAVAALEWYAHTAVPRDGAPKPVQAVPAPTGSAAIAASPSPTAAGSPVVYVQATPAPSPTAAPSAGPPAATPPPATSPPATPEPMVTLAPGVALPRNPRMRKPDAPPEIIALTLSTPVAHPGQIVSGTVETTSNVASVEARIAGYSSNLHKVGEGEFRLSYKVPQLPFFLRRTYTVQVIARNSRGDAVTSSVPITIR